MKTQEEIRKFLDKKIAEKGTNYRDYHWQLDGKTNIFINT